MIKAGIIGGAGYTGGELIRLLLNHPLVDIAFIHSKSNAGKYIHEVHRDLEGETGLKFSNDNSLLKDKWIDILFLCLGHGDSRKFLLENEILQSINIIDLANDFRLEKDANFSIQHTGSPLPVTRNFIYGLPEINKEQIKTAQNVANPGCFATSIQLGLLPLAKAGLLDGIYTTGITGSTGAGQSLSATSHFSWRANNIQAYKTLTHQHLGEIIQSLNRLQKLSPSGEKDIDLSFVPWRGDFTRGIFISSTIHCNETPEFVKKLFYNFYEGNPFVFLSEDSIFLKQVINTNKCLIQLEKVGSKLVVHTALDNLLKGASGQAVQNMNLMFGLDETVGLKLKASGF